ncbi:MAG: class I SAM-dependent methyltransferase [Actinomycetota bacterium]|nr:class I SAM-dependent methyltransferase [Actinomycetota bacterium]
MYGHIDMRPELADYLENLRRPEQPLLTRLRDETSTHAFASMQISREQGDILRFLVQLIGARRILEVGVFTGYSSLVMAGALPEDGQLVGVDQSAEWTAVARRYWEEGGVDGRVDLRLSDGVPGLEALGAEPGALESFDLAFIDADKLNYQNYYEHALRLVRRGGLIVVDNTLWSGDVARHEIQDPDTEAIREFNRYVSDDARVDTVLLPLVDGITLARRRE